MPNRLSSLDDSFDDRLSHDKRAAIERILALAVRLSIQRLEAIESILAIAPVEADERATVRTKPELVYSAK